MTADMIKNERPKVPFAKVVRFGLTMTVKTLPALLIFSYIVLGVAHGLIYGFNTFMTQRFYESVEAVLTHAGSMSAAFMAILALGLTMLLRETLNAVHNFISRMNSDKMIGEMNKIIHVKMARIDPVCLEDPSLHDDINKAMEGSNTIDFIVIIITTMFTFYLPFFAFMAVYLYYLKPVFLISLMLVFIPTLAGQLMRTHIIEKFEDKAAPIRREYDAHEHAITQKTFFKETRLLGGYTYFFRLFIGTMDRLSAADWEASRKTNLINLSTNFFTLLGHGGIIYLLFDALLKGEISAGAFAAVYGAIGLLFDIMNEIVSQHIGHITSSLGKAHNFIRFMELPERGGSAGEYKPELGITAKGVSFRYPNAVEDSVVGVDLHIRHGEIVAIIGENGAGKTTLARLLTGIYKPVTGRVLVHGMDTCDTAAQYLFGHVSGVFQKHQRYQMTLNDNIRISDFGNKQDIHTPLSQAAVTVDSGSFPNGTETMLSREFDGVDLSGGEWQRIAIARGLYRIHDTILLDEPTTAIDPLEESRIYRQFIEMSKNKTAIIITHRLGSTKIADRVLVMNKGKIVDDGTHDSLMKDCPLYQNMYNAQAQWYK